MPKPNENVTEDLDLIKLQELVKHSDMLVNIWAAFKLAAERGDTACIRYHWDQIRAYSKAVSPLVSTLGTDEVASG